MLKTIHSYRIIKEIEEGGGVGSGCEKTCKSILEMNQMHFKEFKNLFSFLRYFILNFQKYMGLTIRIFLQMCFLSNHQNGNNFFHTFAFHLEFGPDTLLDFKYLPCLLRITQYLGT